MCVFSKLQMLHLPHSVEQDVMHIAVGFFAFICHYQYMVGKYHCFYHVRRVVLHLQQVKLTFLVYTFCLIYMLCNKGKKLAAMYVHNIWFNRVQTLFNKTLFVLIESSSADCSLLCCTILFAIFFLGAGFHSQKKEPSYKALCERACKKVGTLVQAYCSKNIGLHCISHT